MKYQNYQKKKPFFAGKGFYIVLAACIVAVGVAAWSAWSTVSTADKDITSSDSSSKEDTSSVFGVGQTVSDVPKEESSSSEKSPVSSESEPTDETSSVTIPEDISGMELTSSNIPLPPKFAIPLRGNIGKTFSDSALQYSATYGDMRLHLGVDIQAEKGAEVISAAAGDVKKVADDAIWGRMVVIDHGSGIICYYCGLENTTVSEGETISAGTPLGVVGTVPCESADKPHIHIAITRDGQYISPLELMKQ